MVVAAGEGHRLRACTRRLPDLTYQYDSHLPASNLFALNAILNVDV